MYSRMPKPTSQAKRGWQAACFLATCVCMCVGQVSDSWIDGPHLARVRAVAFRVCVCVVCVEQCCGGQRVCGGVCVWQCMCDTVYVCGSVCDSVSGSCSGCCIPFVWGATCVTGV
jgi:hypothetical protein